MDETKALAAGAAGVAGSERAAADQQRMVPARLGIVEAIWITGARAGEMRGTDAIEAIAGIGLAGDRYGDARSHTFARRRCTGATWSPAGSAFSTSPARRFASARRCSSGTGGGRPAGASTNSPKARSAGRSAAGAASARGFWRAASSGPATPSRSSARLLPRTPDPSEPRRGGCCPDSAAGGTRVERRV